MKGNTGPFSRKNVVFRTPKFRLWSLFGTQHESISRLAGQIRQRLSNQRYANCHGLWEFSVAPYRSERGPKHRFILDESIKQGVSDYLNTVGMGEELRTCREKLIADPKPGQTSSSRHHLLQIRRHFPFESAICRLMGRYSTAVSCQLRAQAFVWCAED